MGSERSNDLPKVTKKPADTNYIPMLGFLLLQPTTSLYRLSDYTRQPVGQWFYQQEVKVVGK